MTRALSHDDRPEGLPSRARIAELILGSRPPLDTYAGWQHYRTHHGLLIPASTVSPQQWSILPDNRQYDYDLYRELTNANLPLQDTPMHDKVGKLIRRRLSGNTRKKNDPTRAGVMISGWGNYGKTASVRSAGAVFEDQWLQLHSCLNPGAVPGTRDLHAPVVYISTPVTATPKSLCASILGFFCAPTRKSATLPELVRQVADSLHDHGVSLEVS
ncbi:hypothetical protein ACGFR8_24455 [Streptomyces brevispora]|uniref:hypothetical protein n=1 Tax=Streptomyces brevispora TaxID=887462 RepID=UPI00371D658C